VLAKRENDTKCMERIFVVCNLHGICIKMVQLVRMGNEKHASREVKVRSVRG